MKKLKMGLKDAPEESLWENHSQGDAHGKRPQRDTLRTLKEYPFKDITEKIISCAIEVHSLLGPGLLENLNEEAMEHELKFRGIEYKRQKELEIKYKGNPIGNYGLDYLT